MVKTKVFMWGAKRRESQSSCICLEVSIMEKGRWVHRLVEAEGVGSKLDFGEVGVRG